ncbi:hypothetical protein C2S51_021432 [Perilla frutescens var. frutescens]|nr:hypothetical protein C2S51_021432 [Perilla frutescens var. frutescens]
MDDLHVSEESDSCERRDRLSELPDSLILQILSFLPVKDVVPTTLLSKRYSNLWTTIPCLYFWDNPEFRDEFRNFVNRALALWKGTKILKFNMSFMFALPLTSELDSWLLFAIEKQVEELDIDLLAFLNAAWIYGNTEAREYCPPQRLYSCSSIRKLSLAYLTLKIEGNVQWNQLESLKINGKTPLSENVMNQILIGAPLLKVLDLRITDRGGENLNIESSSLKMLKIGRCSYVMGDYGAESDSMLRVWAPNLESLEISGDPYRRCLLNVPSLTTAILQFYGMNHYCSDILLEEMMKHVFLSVHHVEKITLSYWCIKAFFAMKKKDMLVSFSNAKFLKLYVEKDDEILGVVEMFPKLMMLVVERNDMICNLCTIMNNELLFAEIGLMHRMELELHNADMFLRAKRRMQELELHNANMFLRTKSDDPLVINLEPCNLWELGSNFPGHPSLLHLRTVEISWQLRNASIIPFIEILLENARVLEKMVLRPRSFKYVPELLSLIEEKVVSIPRSSSTAKVIIGSDKKPNLKKFSKSVVDSPRYPRFFNLAAHDFIVDLLTPLPGAQQPEATSVSPTDASCTPCAGRRCESQPVDGRRPYDARPSPPEAHRSQAIEGVISAYCSLQISEAHPRQQLDGRMTKRAKAVRKDNSERGERAKKAVSDSGAKEAKSRQPARDDRKRSRSNVNNNDDECDREARNSRLTSDNAKQMKYLRAKYCAAILNDESNIYKERIMADASDVTRTINPRHEIYASGRLLDRNTSGE